MASGLASVIVSVMASVADRAVAFDYRLHRKLLPPAAAEAPFSVGL